eukprot:753858-Hanusia_phi.AAC.13
MISRVGKKEGEGGGRGRGRGRGRREREEGEGGGREENSQRGRGKFHSDNFSSRQSLHWDRNLRTVRKGRTAAAVRSQSQTISQQQLPSSMTTRTDFLLSLRTWRTSQIDFLLSLLAFLSPQIL